MPQFPGMNPYLEGPLFHDLHNALASRIRALLTPLLRPRYAARLEIYTVQDTNPTENLGIVSATLTLPLPIAVRIPTVEVRDTQNNTLVTCIEILSPVNKRQPGVNQYVQKRDRLIRAGIHLVEIDLLRRGLRPLSNSQIPNSHYRMTVARANNGVEVWAVRMQDGLPTIPIPLLPPDPDVPLDLASAIQVVYEEADYDLTIDYTRQPPPPQLSETDVDWLQGVLPPQEVE